MLELIRQVYNEPIDIWICIDKSDVQKKEESQMDDLEPTEINIEISANDATVEEIDKMTRQLLAELRDLNVESAELEKSGIVPQGAKGDPVTIGSIVISALPAVLPIVLQLVQTWSSRGQGRIVKFRGRGIEFEGSAEELQILLQKLDQGQKKK
jgi:hypothetical protein